MATHQPEAARAAKRRSGAGIPFLLILGFFLLLTASGLYLVQAAEVATASTRVAALLERDQTLGVPPARLASLHARLARFERAEWLPTWPMPLAPLRRLSAAAAGVYHAVLTSDAAAAHHTWMVLARLDPYAAQALWTEARRQHQSPRAWLSTRARWLDEIQAWRRAEAQLGPTVGGIPESLLTAEREAESQAASLAASGATPPSLTPLSQAIRALAALPPPVVLRRLPAVLAVFDRVEATLTRDLAREHGQLTPTSALEVRLAQYLATRDGTAAVAVDDLATGTSFSLNPTARFATASIIKAAILGALLWQADRTHQPLVPTVSALAAPMIEESNNDDATALWNTIGGPPGLTPFLTAAGMTDTTPNWAWGLTTTTAPDQIRLLRALLVPGGLLSPTSQAYALQLMTHVVGWEAFGVTSGVPAGVTVALKNGWLPLSTDDWVVNSIGWVNGAGQSYLIAVLTVGSPTFDYGVATVSHVAELVYDGLSSQP